MKKIITIALIALAGLMAYGEDNQKDTVKETKQVEETKQEESTIKFGYWGDTPAIAPDAVQSIPQDVAKLLGLENVEKIQTNLGEVKIQK